MTQVAWKEGLFLRPQHFQYQDECWEERQQALHRLQGAHAYGFSRIQYVKSLLVKGQCLFHELEGVMPDGTVFQLSDLCYQINPLSEPKWQESWLVLTVPLRTRKGIRIAKNAIQAHQERYYMDRMNVSDAWLGEESSLDMEILQENFRLQWVQDLSTLSHVSALPIFKMKAIRNTGEIVLDPDYFPSVLVYRANEPLYEMAQEVSGFLRHRRNRILAQIKGGVHHGSAGMQALFLLQLINRYDPLLQHYQDSHTVHPEQLYLLFVQLSSELRTFTSEERGYAQAPSYQHANLWECFGLLMQDLKAAFEYVFEEPATLISFEAYKHHVYLARFNPMAYHRLVIAINAEMPQDRLCTLFPTQVKLGPVQMIRELVELQIPGLGVRLLPVAPHAIPYHRGSVYFELDSEHELWEALRSSPGLALHLSGDFPGVELALWAIRDPS